MMDRKNQTEHDILNMGNSRFSGEERARMAEEGARAAKGRQRPDTSRGPSAKNGGRQKGKNTSDNRTAPQKKAEGSRNDKVRTSTRQRKKEKKRQNNLLVALLFVAAAAAICIALVFVLKINTIEIVNGSDMYSDSQIASQSGIEAGDSMLLINPAAAGQTIQTALPYIETASVERVWPDKVVITVEYAVTSLVINTGTGYILLNDSCKVLDDNSPVFTEMAAEVKGVEVLSSQPGTQISFGGDIDTGSFAALVTSVKDSGIENVTCYDLSKITDVVLMIDRRIEVKLGTLASSVEKLGFCREVIERTIAEDAKHAIVIDFTSDGTAYARVKNDNHVNYEEITTTPEEETSGEEPADSQEETTASFSVG